MLAHAPALLVMVPMVAAPLCVLARNANAAWSIAVVANAISACMALLLLGATQSDGTVVYAIGDWAPPTGIEYRVDVAGALISSLVAVVSLIVLIYARDSVRRSVETAREYLLYAGWMLCVCGLLGMVVTGDAFNVFVFLEISSLSTYMLIAFGSSRQALVASYRYLILGSVGASFYLIGIGFLYAATGTLNMSDLAMRIPEAESQRAVLVAFTFLTIGLGIKAAVFPLHGWLIGAYQHAPVAVTAFLSGTATKVSLYIMYRIFFSVFGQEYSFGAMLLNNVLLPGAVAGFLIMSLVAIYQEDLRRMLAYSSVAQIGYIVAGLSLATQDGVSASLAHMINHGVVKAALFMAVGCIIYRHGHAHIPSLDRLIHTMPITSAAFILAGLGLIGVPLTPGFVSKFALLGATIESGWWPVTALILVSSVMATVYIGRVVQIIVFREPRTLPAHSKARYEAPPLMLLGMIMMLALGLYLGLFGGELLDMTSLAAAELLGAAR